MYLSKPSLHASLGLHPAHAPILADKIRAFRDIVAPLGASPSTAIEIPLTTVSMSGNFDSYIEVFFAGSSDAPGEQLLFDSGNSVLIIPHWEAIAPLVGAGGAYRFLGTTTEPWGCPANVVAGPIRLRLSTGEFYTIDECVFYACTADASDGTRTANFGAGCLSPWEASSWNTQIAGVTLQAPLSYDKQHPFIEIDYAPAQALLNVGDTAHIASGSVIRLYSEMPSGYQLFDILPDLSWMSIYAKSLSIEGHLTDWPGDTPNAIAMVDCGGGPVFLSDPQRRVCDDVWPDEVDNPTWTANSTVCRSTRGYIELTVGSSLAGSTYRIDPSIWDQSVQGLTLVMCEMNEYMRGQFGMNLGGLSALANYIVIDYQGRRVGLRTKT